MPPTLALPAPTPPRGPPPARVAPRALTRRRLGPRFASLVRRVSLPPPPVPRHAPVASPDPSPPLLPPLALPVPPALPSPLPPPPPAPLALRAPSNRSLGLYPAASASSARSFPLVGLFILLMLVSPNLAPTPHTRTHAQRTSFYPPLCTPLYFLLRLTLNTAAALSFRRPQARLFASIVPRALTLPLPARRPALLAPRAIPTGGGGDGVWQLRRGDLRGHRRRFRLRGLRGGHLPAIHGIYRLHCLPRGKGLRCHWRRRFIQVPPQYINFFFLCFMFFLFF